jgi:hypothetical protein
VIGNGSEHALVMELDLAPLVRNHLSILWFDDTDSFDRVAQNTNGRAYVVRNITDSSARVSTWDEASDIVLAHDVGHAQIPERGYTSVATQSPTAFDWVANRSQGARILGVTKRQNELWVLWGAGRCFGDPAISGTCPSTGNPWPQPPEGEDFISMVSASPGTTAIPTIQGDCNGIAVDYGALEPRRQARTQFVVAGYAQVFDSTGQRYHPYFARFARS